MIWRREWESTFKLNNMPYIKILDKAGNVVAGEGSGTELKLNEKVSHGKQGADKNSRSRQVRYRPVVRLSAFLVRNKCPQ